MRSTLRQAQDDLFRVLTMTFKVIQDDGFWRLEDGFPTTNLGNDKDGSQPPPPVGTKAGKADSRGNDRF